jgi:peptidoglycan hydrolase-like protein with peptidoglycan-binding domain
MKKYLYLALGLSLLFGGFYFTSPVKAESCDPEALVPVSYGQRGSAVRNAQACLMEAGYDIPAGATGYYGEQTRRAVQAFYQDWYGNWDGRRLGPRGVAELKSRLAAAPEEGSYQPSQPSQPSQQDQTSALVAAVLAALQQMGLLPSTSTQQQAAGEEGFLTVDKDPTVAAVTLREGESGRVVGLRFRADNGAVGVQSVFLRWTSSVAPHRVISALKVVDSQGNVLYQTNVGPSTFLQDSSLNYYLPVSGLNVNVPKNGYASVFVEVTVVGTLPSGVSSLSFAVNQNDVRGRDGAGIDRFGPSSTLTWSATLQPSLAGNARFVLALNPNTPKQGYLFGDPTDGRAYKVKVLSFDVTAKNDNLRVTKVEGSVTNTSTVQAVYLAQGNNVMDVRTPSATGTFVFDVTPANFTVNRDQTVTFDVLVDFVAPSVPTVAFFRVSVATTTGVNSLGDVVSSTSTTVTSEMMRAVRVGPRFAAVEKTISVTRDQNNSTTTVQSVVFRVNVTAVGGPLYVPAANTATITLETASGTTSTVSVAPTAVRVGTTLVSALPSGYYAVPEGATYEFEFRTSGQTFTGAQSVRARLSNFAFDNDTNPPVMGTSPFLHDLPEFWTNWSN